MQHEEETIFFAGEDWQKIKRWAAKQKEIKVGLLVSNGSHDESNKIRGSLLMLQQLLALENAAKQAATRNQ